MRPTAFSFTSHDTAWIIPSRLLAALVPVVSWVFFAYASSMMLHNGKCMQTTQQQPKYQFLDPLAPMDMKYTSLVEDILVEIEDYENRTFPRLRRRKAEATQSLRRAISIIIANVPPRGISVLTAVGNTRVGIIPSGAHHPEVGHPTWRKTIQTLVQLGQITLSRVGKQRQAFAPTEALRRRMSALQTA